MGIIFGADQVHTFHLKYHENREEKVSWTVLSIEFVYGTFRAVEVTRNFIAMNIEYVIVKIGAQYVMYNLC